MQSSARNWFDKQESRQMGNQYWYLTYFMTSQQQVHAEHAMLDTHLSSQYVKDKNKLKTDLYGIFQSSNRSNFFMDFWYKKYAGNQKGCTFRMPVYGVKGHSGKISRMLNYSEIFFGSEEGMNAEAFGDLIFGTKYIREEETVTDTAPLVEEAQGNAVSRSIASEDAEAVCKVLEKLWEAQETSPDTRFIILMEDAENKSMELLRELYLMLPNRLRLQMGFQTNITQADLNQIRNNNGLPIYVLTAERKDFKELTEAYPFPIVIYDMTQADAYTYDEDRLKLLRDLARKTDGKTITKLSYAERKVIETKEGIASSFKYYREVVTEMDNDRLYWWKNKEIASIGELTEALKDQKELMGNQELLDESLLAFFKQMIPEGTYAEQIIDLIQDESNPDRDTILETLGSSLCISKEIDAVKALIDKLKEEKTKALAEKEAAEREQKALELAAQQKSYEEEIRKKMADHEAEMKSVQDTHAAELKAKEEAAATVQKALDEKSRLFDKVCETNKSNAETVQALKATVSQKDKEIAQRDSDLAQLRLLKAGVGEHDADGGVAGELVVHHGMALPHALGGGAQAVPCLVQEPRHLPSGLPVENIPQGVDHHHRAELQLPELNGIAAHAGLHAMIHPGILAHRRPAARAKAAVPVVRRVHGQPGGLAAHGRVRAHRGVPHGQVVDVRLGHQRHQRAARVVADAALLQILHHPVRRAQAVGAAPGQHDGVDALGRHQRVEQLALPAGGAAAAHVQPGAHPLGRDEYRAAGGCPGVLRLADADRPDLRHRDLPQHISHPGHSLPVSATSIPQPGPLRKTPPLLGSSRNVEELVSCSPLTLRTDPSHGAVFNPLD